MFVFPFVVKYITVLNLCKDMISWGIIFFILIISILFRDNLIIDVIIIIFCTIIQFLAGLFTSVLRRQQEVITHCRIWNCLPYIDKCSVLANTWCSLHWYISGWLVKRTFTSVITQHHQQVLLWIDDTHNVNSRLAPLWVPRMNIYFSPAHFKERTVWIFKCVKWHFEVGDSI